MSVCPKCGTPSKGLCKSCAPNPLLSRLKDLHLIYCCRSNTAKIGHKWVSAPTLQDAVVALVEHKMEIPKGVKVHVALEDENIPIGPGVQRRTKLRIHAQKRGIEEDIEVPIFVEITISPAFSKAGTRYFEGTLQLRNYQEKHHKHILEFIHKEFAKLEERGAFVTKEEREKDGYDFYVTKQSYLPTLARKVTHEFGGEVLLTSKVFTLDWQTSKDVHRGAVLLTLPDFVKGEVILVEGELYQVLSSKDKNFSCTRLKDFSSVKFDLRYHKYKIVATKEDILSTKVSIVQPHLEVLHPSTYQSQKVENKKFPKAFKSQENVHVVEYENQLWIVD